MDSEAIRKLKPKRKPAGAPESTGAKAKPAAVKVPKVKTLSARKSDSKHDVDTTFKAVFISNLDSGSSVTMIRGDESENLVMGLALPTLATRFLFQRDSITLNRNYQIVGPRGSCKSSLLYEMLRWTLANQGMGNINENEGKDAPELRNSILENKPEWLRRYMLIECSTMEDWQRSIVENVQRIDNHFSGRNAAAAKAAGKLHLPDDEPEDEYYSNQGKKKKDKPRNLNCLWDIPFFIGVDSFTGTNAEATQTKIDSQGAASRGFSEEALSLSKYSKHLTPLMRGRPIILAGTNHIKPGTDSMNRPVENIPGGKALGYAESTELRMDRLAFIEKIDHGGVKLLIKNRKNSLGQTNRKIKVDMLWKWTLDANGQPQQHTFFDWYAANVALLLDLRATQKTIANQINDIVDIRQLKNRFWSKTLGIPASDPVFATTLGAALEGRPDLLHAIYPILRIRRTNIFKPGIPYSQQLDGSKAYQPDTRTLYKIHDLSTYSFISAELKPSKVEDSSEPEDSAEEGSD
jgi:hypothetical protein